MRINNAGRDVYAHQGNGSMNIYRAAESRPDPVPVRERNQVRVLMLAANPMSTTRLPIDEEARQIAQRLRMARDRDDFDLIPCQAVRVTDLLQYLNQHRPHIVHFSGHGDPTGEIVLAAGDGTDRRVTAEGLAGLFRAVGGGIRVVVLNACYSAVQAAEISRYVDYVIGMSAPIPDDAATVFAGQFYSTLGFGHTIPHAFDQASAMLTAYTNPGREVPQLLARPHANPHLTGEPR
ncbi:CHAT domain-containing protein [Dactylosporangium sp. NPDC051541]|uniref:CHAT domain-containing protein n=1 Tax=Dactylosporangium sp. NPDC051541 TaxID=3363977 RepID=UPI0037911B71